MAYRRRRLAMISRTWGAVLSVARPAWGYEVDPLAMPDARKVLRKLGMVSKSKERNRRPTLDELDRLMAHFFEMQVRRPESINMPKMIAFALFSTRRLFEMDWDIPRVSSVSGHRDWNSLRRYTHLRGRGDQYHKWNWLQKVSLSAMD